MNALEQLIQLLAKIPGLGPRSGRRAALHLIKSKEYLMLPLIAQLQDVAQQIKMCQQCYNWDVQDPCHICTHPGRDEHSVCVVADVADLWAIERSKTFQGRYHVLGGVLSAIEGVGPSDLKIEALVSKLQNNEHIREVILALSATLDGQVTGHYIQKALSAFPVKVTVLAHGVPMGGELDYLDEGTLSAAFTARRSLVG